MEISIQGETVSIGGVPISIGNVELSKLSSVVLQAEVLISRGRTDEGLLVKCVVPAWVEIIRLIEKDPNALYQIDPRKLEEIIAGAYDMAGFEDVTLTPRSSDLGRDVIAVKRGIGTVRIIDQVKAFSPGHLVTANDVRALAGILEPDGAAKGFVTTTSDFAPKIQEDDLLKFWFERGRIELINGTRLTDRLKELVGGSESN